MRTSQLSARHGVVRRGVQEHDELREARAPQLRASQSPCERQVLSLRGEMQLDPVLS